MKKLSFFSIIGIILIVLLFACQVKTKKVNPEAEIASIENVLDQYVIANENQDFRIIENIWSKEENIELIGTDSDELLTGWESIRSAIKNQFESFENTYISVNDQHIHINNTGNTAWFFETLNYNFLYKGEAMSFEGIRFTGVLEKRGNKWELVQGHLSIPAEVDVDTE
ncbi:MAG: nuclear transport factor 2 family protein [Bacteroidales bacterium]|nr:nuclear transport factor 2 family protein [Bacteroidales bacterium]MCF8387453.1 nuclear transport factor 2 family protein [Bacteroidales bacterium]MCF8397453.1 nuclear transport factor 2 family protein [Bacteroidales bacterium]